MKINWIYIATFLIVFGFAFTLNRVTESPEVTITGKWVEAEWTYDLKSDKKNYTEQELKKVPDHVKNLVGQNFKIHSAETWNFLPNNRLILTKKNGEQVHGEWRIKGRGHVLKMMFDDGTHEYYDIKELDSNRLEINFDIGMEVRGIARLTFERQSQA
jgi:hypothetical protein